MAEHGLSSGTSGDYSIESKLKTVRNKLAFVNKKLNDLDHTMIMLIARPELVTVNNSTFSNTSVQAEPPIEIFDRAELHSEVGDYMGFRQQLMQEAEDLYAALKREKGEDYTKHYTNSLNLF